MTTHHDFDLAFEHKIGDAPGSLWRVLSTADFKGRKHKRSEWFASERVAWRQAKWLMDNGHEVISVTNYQPTDKPNQVSR